MHTFYELVRSYLGEEDIDTAIVDYLVNIAGDVEDEAMSVDDYVDLVLLMAPESQLHAAGRDYITKTLRDMLDQASKRNGTGDVSSQANEAEASVEKAGPMRLSKLLHQSRTQDKTEHTALGTEGLRSASSDLVQLSEITGNCLTDGYLEHILCQTAGNVQAAACWLIEQQDVMRLEAEWVADREKKNAAVKQKQQVDARDKQELKKLIVNQFAFAEERQRTTRPNAAIPWGNAKGVMQADPPQIRYRDGMKVTSRGEKHILISEPEWDGGSRGKVFTKGKRGKGYS